ncbi:MAG: hypothetical protein HWQ38_24175 [Nostoc sp. NMS7]|uniref:hypothetical protein n=1 Tax=Nostoc sp. NMS7 TaxID=2815391 RepID=UPI0025F44124|nr:hypothetical protein [Nostoc sp. NMS7]MBN3949391.1 hypothetical protein [Nostoc sp. NMS7]
MEQSISAKITQNEHLGYDALLTQEYILKLAQSEPKLGVAVGFWRGGDISWEKATYLMILELLETIRIARRNSELSDLKIFPETSVLES